MPAAAQQRGCSARVTALAVLLNEIIQSLFHADLCAAMCAPLVLQTCVAYPTSDVTIATHQASFLGSVLLCYWCHFAVAAVCNGLLLLCTALRDGGVSGAQPLPVGARRRCVSSFHLILTGIICLPLPLLIAIVPEEALY